MDFKETRKNNIDEALLMSIMAGEVQPVEPENSERESPLIPSPAESKTDDRAKGKKLLEGSYGDRFLRSHTMSKRGEKSIYIRPEYHVRLSRIVQIIGDDNIPLYAYLDNILKHHFELFEKPLLEEFNNRIKPLF